MARPWDSFSACARRCGSSTLEGLVANPEVAWLVPPGLPPAPSRIIFFALDAVAHHRTIEWREGARRGWRVIQSYMKPERRPSEGYNALQWLSAGRPCGGADASTHQRFGQGRWLSDAEALEFLRAIAHLRRLADALVTDCLLPQMPFDIGPRPSDEDRPALQAWLECVQPVSGWAAMKIEAAETLGATVWNTAEDVHVALGDPARGDTLESLLRIPVTAAAELDDAYAAVTGESFSAIHYLKLLNYLESDNCSYGDSAEERQRQFVKEQERERLLETSTLDGCTGGAHPGERDHRGWAVRTIHWAED